VRKPSSSVSASSQQSALIAEITSGGFKLRSIAHCKAERRNDDTPVPPSLSDILSARKQLKKVVIAPDPEREKERTRRKGGDLAFLQDIAAGAYQLRPLTTSFREKPPAS
jgi:hypothetical protein